MDNGRPTGLLLVARTPVAASRAFLCTEFEKAEAGDLRALLAGRPPAGGVDNGRTICVCHGVGEKEIERAIAFDGASDPDAVGRLTKAGTGCGSCRSEVRRMLKDAIAKAPAPHEPPEVHALEPAE
jgi:assimilatory nitrate reductase catalytic subunit